MSTATNTIAASYLQINRQDHDQVGLQQETLQAPAAGEALLRVQSFALTANNITYAEFGDVLHYWQFFPAPSGWGRLPVWGFAEVMASQSEYAPVGQRYYGFYPAGSHLRVRPQPLGSSGFVDTAPHRAQLPAIYNQYLACPEADNSGESEAATTAHDEALEALLRPLFTTSFLIAQSLLDQGGFAAQHAVLSSASSKTALGTAYLLREMGVPLHRVGLSSTANLDFLRQLRLYDQLLDYRELDPLAELGETVSIDFAGNREVLSQVHAHLGTRLRHSWLVGGAHWQAHGASASAGSIEARTSGPKPQVFFAPSVAEHYLRQWGGGGFQQRITQLWANYQEFARSWLEVLPVEGLANVTTAYQQVRQNQVRPQQGLMVRL